MVHGGAAIQSQTNQIAGCRELGRFSRQGIQAAVVRGKDMPTALLVHHNCQPLQSTRFRAAPAVTVGVTRHQTNGGWNRYPGSQAARVTNGERGGGVGLSEREGGEARDAEVALSWSLTLGSWGPRTPRLLLPGGALERRPARLQ